MIGLKYIRTTFGDTIIDLANKLDISNVMVSYWENRKKPISKKKLEALSNIYGLKEKYFTKELTLSEQMMITQMFGNKVDEKDFYIEQLLDKLRSLMRKIQ